MKPLLLSTLVSLFAICAAPAHAAEPADHATTSRAIDAHDTARHDVSHHSEPRNVLGVRAVGGALLGHHDHGATRGIGLLAERAFWGHRLALELVGTLLWHGEHATGASGELVLQLPRKVSETVNVYAGGGMVLEHVDHHNALGAVLDAGTTFWLGRTVGLGMEVDLLLVGREPTAAVEGVGQVLFRL